MRRFFATIIALAPASSLAQSGDLEMFEKANSLGTVLASEAVCGLSYDQAAIQQWIADNVPPDNMEFAPTLQTMVLGADYNLQNMSPSAKTAHCAAVTQSAKHYGFVK